MSRSAVLAEHSGLCPLCSRWITKHRSWIDSLPIPLVPMEGVVYRPGRGWSYEWAGDDTVRLTPRRWAHADCARRWCSEHPPRTWDAVARGRREVMAGRKAEALLNDLVRRHR